ncbi:legumain-like [Pocillopora verrucosa]|uniref:legumain-like n=1 Tax=Pocillopora verrucosa TaxID=203993 RepID=UPI003341EC21
MLAGLLILSLSFLAASAETGKHWALIVAGSNGWYNYRHQADTCHAYQILHKNGIPDENIVVMMYDDIANNPSNPTPGIIINKPNGDDVYKGVPKDYTKEDVTPDNFLNILKGWANYDHVFVYFTDHGSTGLIAFPSDALMVHDLIAALDEMYENKKFSKDFVSDVLDDFQGDGMGSVSGKSPEEYRGEPITDAIPSPDVELNILHHRLKDSASLAERQEIAREIEELLEREEGVRKTMESIVEQCTSSEEQKTRVLKTRADPEDFDCYKQAVKTFSKTCYNLGQNDHALRHVYALSNLCEENIPTEM